MKKVIFATLFFLIGCEPKPAPTPTPSPNSGVVVFVDELIVAHNKVRTERGLSVLVKNEALQQAAEKHAKDMAANTFMSHRGSDWASPFTRMERAGYAYSIAGENVAWNQKDVETVMKAWMNSLGHRANILKASYTEVGAACVYSASGQPYWCVDFGRPSGVVLMVGPPKETHENHLETSSVTIE